jgi:MinD-like ATPase involved in chromosome partitioning or flagellar assembly
MIVVVASIKGAPGVTTTAGALASTWPPGRKVLLVEADPFGGDLAAWFGVAPSTGLWSLLAAGRRGLDPHAVWEHATNLPTGLAVLYGLASADQAVANEAAWPAVAEVLAALDADVVIDAGRLLPHFAGGIGPLLSVAQVLLVLCPPTLAGIVHLKTALPSLIDTSASRQLLVLPTASKGFSSEEIASTLKIDVAPTIPHDPKGATALSANAIGSERSKTTLAKWARSTAAELVAFPSDAPLSLPEITNHRLRSPVDDTEQLNNTEQFNETAQSQDIEPLSDTEPLVAPTWVAR